MHPRERFVRKLKNTGNDVTFIKQVPFRPHDRSGRKVRDSYDNMQTVDYNNDDINISDAETINYQNDNEAVQTTVKTKKPKTIDCKKD